MWYQGFITFLETHQLTCPSRALLHMECPGCGMQRSFIALLKGHLAESLFLHPATVPMLALIIYAVYHLLTRRPNGAKIIVILQLTVALLTFVFYIYKISTRQIIV